VTTRPRHKPTNPRSAVPTASGIVGRVGDAVAPLTEALVQQWADDLAGAPRERRYLIRERGLTVETLREFQIGWDGHRITIPIRDAGGTLINVRRYRRNPKPGESKMLHLKGHGSGNRIAFLDRLPATPGKGKRSVVIVAGGEWDAISAIQAGFHAVSPTSGEGSNPHREDIQKLAGWLVRLCLDTDKPGRSAAVKWATALDGVAGDIKDVVLPVPKDVNDWFAKHHKTAKQLISVMRETPLWGARRDSQELLGIAWEQVSSGESRNHAGFWLACQLRDERYSQPEAAEVMVAYQSRVEALKVPPYTPAEARSSVESAYSRPPRSAVGQANAGYMLTDYGNAQRFCDEHSTDMRYVGEQRRWYAWDGRRWAVDETGEVMRWAKETVRAMQTAARSLPDEEARKKLARHAAGSESAAKLNAMVALAQTELDVVARVRDFDTDPLLLNCRNGVLDQRDGQLHDHRREDMCRRLVPVDYDPTAKAPLWDGFLARVLPDQDVRAFVQRAVGYSITGLTTEEKLLFLHGFGANGKTTFCETVKAVSGDYGQQMPFETLLDKPRSAGSPSSDLARLDGARFVLASESKDGDRFDEQRIKRLTGRDTMTARFLFGNDFEFQPQCTIWVAANHKPVVRGTDDAIWRRFLLVPFEVQIPESERDLNLAERLRAELPGILRWAVDGCLAWQREGLNPPAAVTSATEEYRSDSDVLGQFFEDCCELDVETRTSKTVVYETYKSWCGRVGLVSMSQIAFSRRMRERGLEEVRIGAESTRGWGGVRVVETDGDGKIHLSMVRS
jgi:P4 family phage/plasmid primase-like protien